MFWMEPVVTWVQMVQHLIKNITWIRAKKIEKFLGSCQFGSNSSVCFDYAAAVYNFLHTTAYWGLVLLVPCLGVRGNCIASDLRWETNWVSDLTFYAIDKKRDCSGILRSFSFRLSYFFLGLFDPYEVTIFEILCLGWIPRFLKFSYIGLILRILNF